MNLSAQSQTTSNDIECIVFDVYGTLFDLKSFAKENDRFYHKKGEEILDIVREKQLQYALTRSLVGRYKDYDSITKSVIRFALEEMKLEPKENVIEELYLAFLRLEPFPDVDSALNDLDQFGTKVMLLSNGSQEMLDKLVEHAGLSLLADEVVSVEGSRTYKPDPKAYEHALNHLEFFEKRRIFYVSGNPWDVAGAKAFGFRVGWVNRTKQSSFDDEFRDLTPDYEFPTLEMKKLLIAESFKI
jgi:2-haloacid dehalogenase